MKIGLVPVDNSGNFPNLPLMKLSAWHKLQGDKVKLFNKYSLKEADRVYMSKIFTFSPEYAEPIYAKEVIKSGTGYYYPDGGEPLSDEIEHIMPDYSLFDIKDTAYGFLTRGCPRNCGFCIVTKKEGRKSVKVADVAEFWNCQKEIVLLDPNILACKEHIRLLDDLRKTGAAIDFTQGLDARLLNDENTALLANLKIKAIHFAFDNYGDKDIITQKLKLFKEKTKKTGSIYILCNYNTNIEQDLERIDMIYRLGYLPYVMVYNRDGLPADHELRRIQRWANSPAVFTRSPDYTRYKKSAVLFKEKRREQNSKKWTSLL
ncbi:MAG: radical SAM protein [Tannerella sp.]|jgi:hypothetical protein|nr:radical SAM protein [Tannerella sp.]